MKKFMIIFTSTIVLVIGLYLSNYSTNENVLKSNNIKVAKDKTIAIMLSNQAGDGYYESSSDTFPTGMVLNTTLSSCENGGTISYDGTNVTVEVNRTDRCYVYFDGPSNYLADIIKNLYSYDGDGSNLYYHDQTGNSGSYVSAEYEAGDLSYRYAGPSVNISNYVCFASDEETCPSDNLYRIIGVFKDNNNDYQVKLIKASEGKSSLGISTMLGTNGDYYSDNKYYWNNSSGTSSKAVWSASRLNTINLNTNFINYLNAIDSKWLSMIETHTWIVAGNTWTLLGQTAGVQNVYDKEIVNPAANTTYSDEIGLMYVSDYMYGASPTHWYREGGYSSSTDYRNAKNDNWLYLGKTEWIITRLTTYDYTAFIIKSSGDVGDPTYVNGYNYGYSYVYKPDSITTAYYIRPTFYLKPSVKYAGGSGTAADPYRIS